MSKRPVEDTPNSGAPTKKVSTTYLPHTIGPVSNSTELDINVLKFQNKKLANRIEQRKRTENELRTRIDQLESRQTQDDAVLNAVNRYWNQFNEDIRILLQRFDAETADEQESKNESEVTSSFLAQLSTWDKAELDENLANRVQISKRAVGKIIQVFDRLMQRNDKILQLIKGEDQDVINIEESLREQIEEVIKENRNLQEKNIELHSKNQTIMLNEAKILESLAAHETAEAELKHKIDGLEYELEKVRCRNDKLENHLAEAIEKIKNVTVHGGDAKNDKTSGSSGASMTTVASLHLEELKKELEEYKELSANRFQEIEKLNEEKAQLVNEIDKLKMDMRHLPESVIVETTEYKILQSQFSVLYNESMQINTMLDEARAQLQKSKTEYQRYIEYLESNELDEQKKLRNELLQKQYVLDQTRKEFDNLRNKYEQNLAANEQTAPINREMRQLITSLQNRNGQFKKEIQRYKRKYKDISAENTKLRKDLEEMATKLNVAGVKPEKDIKNESVTSVSNEDEQIDVKNTKEEPILEKVKLEPEENDSESEEKPPLTPTTEVVKKEETPSSVSGNASNIAKLERENRDLKAQLKKALNDLKDTKVVMDTYKGVGKEQRDKVQLMAAEKKVRQELEELKAQMKKLQDIKRDDRKDRKADEDLLRKLKQIEDKNCELQKQLATQKAVDGQWGFRTFVGSNEEEALLNEIELTGQAYDEMQEQNDRLLQQLSSKDDANFKLITDRINASQKQALLSAQINELEKQIQYQEHQMETLITLKRKLEEKEKILLNTITNLEKEVDLKQKAMETYKRKATESAQSAQELKMHLEKYVTMLVETQQMMDQKATRFMQESNKSKNLLEELNVYKRKVDRMKNLEMEMSGATIDEVILQENREYKEALTCDSCKVKQKDAVLTKCFHVFCYECLRNRYDSRQRKCPKCNAAFGANDFHRLYLT
ncbi:hypothetical protein PVAND_011365 [Polypedilum vanderplanki]|uniref:E3 ubiquitin protein ligase n=1 Tax=Polypedilum vanderplanki TaxID=319348 RepID=A0A9J6CJ28_POLVA|nr:hypothetical protein PVAND_011365 [Polypedilum vanderplanki]